MSAIKNGDLVMVVKPRDGCGCSQSIGRIFRVLSVGIRRPLTKCAYCKLLAESKVAAFDGDSVFELHRIIKIDPPETGETTEAYRNVPNREMA